MRRLPKKTLGLLILAMTLGLTMGVSDVQARPASCLLHVGGEEIFRGTCDFTPTEITGSFIIRSYNGRYFAHVIISSPGVAQGYWNGAPYAKHAHRTLGKLYRDDGCWVNDFASVCAY